MKISKESFNIMKEAMKSKLLKISESAVKNFDYEEYTKETFLDEHTKGNDKIKDTVFYAANLLLKFSKIDGHETPSHFVCDVIYDIEGCNDTHLKTALKKIWGEL